MFKKISPWLFGVYCLLCIAPFFIPALNTIEPTIFGLPFTVFWVLLVALSGCLLIKYLSVHVWEGYDNEVEEEVIQTIEVKEGGQTDGNTCDCGHCGDCLVHDN